MELLPGWTKKLTVLLNLCMSTASHIIGKKKSYKTLSIKCKTAQCYQHWTASYIDFLLPVSRPDINQSEHLNYIISRTSVQGASFFYSFLPSKPGIYNSDIANERRMIYGTVKNAETRFNMAIQFWSCTCWRKKKIYLKRGDFAQRPKLLPQVLRLSMNTTHPDKLSHLLK